MDDNMELTCFQIISNSGTAKSCYIDAIQKAKEQDYQGVEAARKEAETCFIEAHKIHAQLIQQEAAGHKTEFSLLFMHAEDQMASAELAKLLADEIIALYQKLDSPNRT